MTVQAAFGGPCAWRASEQRGSSEWEYRLTRPQIAELLTQVRDLVGDHPPHPSEVTHDDLPLHGLRSTLDGVLSDLLDGRGFALLRGVPVDELTVLEAELVLWGIGLRLGIPIPQNPAGDVIVHVRDEGRRFSDPSVRAYETSEQLEYHTDSGDIVGLLCLKPARRGGVSTIASAVAIHDEMVRLRPDLARELHEPWWRVSLLEGKVSRRPICEALGDRLYFGYGRMYLERASQQRSEIPPLTANQLEALDLFDELANSEDFRLDMHFAPGDIQFLNNYVILHARTEYDDWPEPERRRDLCRLWLVRDDLSLPPTFVDSGIVPRTVGLQSQHHGAPPGLERRPDRRPAEES